MLGLVGARTVVRGAALTIAMTAVQVLLPSSAAGRILLFEDATAGSGIDLSGVTHSVAWGDFNNDGCPDLWISKHSGDDGQAANLYQNLCNGRFVDVTTKIVGTLTKNLDFHGAAWADFNNDGDVDLIQLRGADGGLGVGPNLRARLFVNSGGKLTDRATELGVDYPLARGRMPLWLDYDNDGKLDLFFGADQRPDGKSPPTIFDQVDHAFKDARSATGFNLMDSRYAVLADLNNDRRMEFIAVSGLEGAQDLDVFETRELPFVDLTRQFLSGVTVKKDFSEIAVADFNNDLRPDIYITRRGFGNEVAPDASRRTIRAEVGARVGERGFSFRYSGKLGFAYSDMGFPKGQIFIGSRGVHPGDPTFTLSSDDPKVAGIFPHGAGQRGIYIGYNPAQTMWQYLTTGDVAGNANDVKISSVSPVQNLATIGFPLFPKCLLDQLLINTGSHLKPRCRNFGSADRRQRGGRSRFRQRRRRRSLHRSSRTGRQSAEHSSREPGRRHVRRRSRHQWPHRHFTRSGWIDGGSRL